MKADPPRRVEFLGCPLDCLTSGELLDELKNCVLAKAPPKVIQFVNANKVAMVRSEPWMGELLARADYVLADGQPMLPMAAMLGLRIPERIDGIGLMHKLMRLADHEREVARGLDRFTMAELIYLQLQVLRCQFADEQRSPLHPHRQHARAQMRRHRARSSRQKRDAASARAPPACTPQP